MTTRYQQIKRRVKDAIAATAIWTAIAAIVVIILGAMALPLIKGLCLAALAWKFLK